MKSSPRSGRRVSILGEDALLATLVLALVLANILLLHGITSFLRSGRRICSTAEPPRQTEDQEQRIHGNSTHKELPASKLFLRLSEFTFSARGIPELGKGHER